MQGVHVLRSANQDNQLKSSAKPSLLKGTLDNRCLRKGSGLMRHVASYSIAIHLARETNCQQQVMTVYVHMLGKMLSFLCIREALHLLHVRREF